MAVLTETIIRRAKPRERKYEIACSRVRGLRLRVLPTGKKVFVVRVFSNGRDRRVRIGLVGQVTLAEARSRAAAIVAEARGHTSPSTNSNAAPSIPTTTNVRFRDLAREYATRHVETDSIALATKKNYRRALKLLSAEFGGRLLTDIRYAEVEAFHRSMADTPSAANSHLRVMNHMFRKASQWDMFPWGSRFPTSGLKYFREEGRERFLTPQERARLERVLVEAASKRPNRKGYVRWSHLAVIRLLSLTGCRTDEILSLRWDWVDSYAGVLRLPKSKTGKSIRPVSDDVFRLLEEIEVAHRRPEIPLVCYGTRLKKIEKASIKAVWDRVRRRANLEDVRLHDLRHSAASDAINAGVPLEVVGELLGHKSVKTTKRYAHIANRVARVMQRRR